MSMFRNSKLTFLYIVPARHYLTALYEEAAYVIGDGENILASIKRAEGTIQFDNGSRIMFMTPDEPERLCGMRFDRVIVSEFVEGSMITPALEAELHAATTH